MRGCAAVAVREAEVGGRNFHAAVKRPATTSLVIPEITKQATFRYTQGDCMQKMAALGLALARRGFLEASDVQGDLPSAVKASMGRWMDSMWGGMRWFAFRGYLMNSVLNGVTDDVSEMARDWGAERTKAIFIESCGIDPSTEHVGIGLVGSGRMDVLVGEGVERLEAVREGLGWSVLSEVEQACQPYDLFGMRWTEMAAETAYWCGMPSEIEWAEECGEPLEEYSGMTREQFEKNVPIKRWDAAPKLNHKVLAEIAKGESKEGARAASLLIQLRRLAKVQPMFDMQVLGAEADWYDSVSPSVLLGWKDMRAVESVGDDFSEMLMNGGADLREWTGLMGVPTSGQQSLRETELRWKLPLKKLRLADALLSEIGQEA